MSWENLKKYPTVSMDSPRITETFKIATTESFKSAGRNFNKSRVFRNYRANSKHLSSPNWVCLAAIRCSQIDLETRRPVESCGGSISSGFSDIVKVFHGLFPEYCPSS